MGGGHQRLFVDRNVLDLARERIADCYRRFDRVVVSFSGGKDSTVVLDLACEVAAALGKGPVEVLHWDEEAIHPETVDYVRRVSQRPDVRMHWMCYPIKHRNACSRKSPWWHPWAPEEEHLWVRPMPPEGITRVPGEAQPRLTFPEMQGFVLNDPVSTVTLNGVRAQESIRRLRSVLQREHDNWLAPSAMWPHIVVAKPIYDWHTEDVWTAPAKFGWDYNRTYDVLTMAGVARHEQRVCPPFGEEPLQGLSRYASCWPDLWEKMTRRVPGAATAGRYCQGPAYGFFDRRRTPPEGQTWQEAIADAIRLWPKEMQPQLAARIKADVAEYVRSSGKPLPDYASDGELCWSMLLTIAQRGDLKHRRARVPRDRLRPNRAKPEDRLFSTPLEGADNDAVEDDGEGESL